MEGVYLVHTREFINADMPIYKLGRSYNIENRTNQYPRGSNVLFMIMCENSIECENYLIKLFKEKFIQKTYYGREYFEGDKKLMIQEIFNYINNKNNDNIDDIDDIDDINNIDNINDIDVNDVNSIKFSKPELIKMSKPDIINILIKLIINNINNNKEPINNEKTTNINNKYNCKICNKTFANRHSLYTHNKLNRCKINNIKDEINKKDDLNITKMYNCKKCDLKFSNRQGVYTHNKLGICKKKHDINNQEQTNNNIKSGTTLNDILGININDSNNNKINNIINNNPITNIITINAFRCKNL